MTWPCTLETCEAARPRLTGSKTRSHTSRRCERAIVGHDFGHLIGPGPTHYTVLSPPVESQT
jgi:hypothetical protein